MGGLGILSDLMNLTKIILLVPHFFPGSFFLGGSFSLLFVQERSSPLSVD